jgi:hypothetical protein
VGSESDQSVGGSDVELRDQHAGGLADVGVGELVQLGPRPTPHLTYRLPQVLTEQVQHRQRGQLGRDHGAGQVVAVQTSRADAEQVERAEVLPAQDDR